MQYRKLGRTDITVSAIALGCYQFERGAVWGEPDEKESIATIRSALDLGITFFDTAEAYGDGYSEELLGQAVAGQRDKVVIASKVSPHNLAPDALKTACENSLKRLRTDYIDLYQIHWPNRDVPLEDTVGALEELKQAGHIRAMGVSNFGIQDLSDFLELAHPESNQLPYNLIWRAIEHELVPACLEHEVGVLTYSSLMQGLLTGKFKTADEVPDGRSRSRHFSKSRPLSRHDDEGFEEETFAVIRELSAIADEAGSTLAQLAIAWLLTRPAVTSVLVGAKTPAQLAHNVEAAELDVPDPVIAKMTTATDDLKEKLGPNPDMWQSESRYR